jgi:wee1-like protein kinase
MMEQTRDTGKHPVFSMQEVQATAAVQAHGNIMRYYSAWAEPDIQGDHLYMQLELCGHSLSAVLAADRTGWREFELVTLMKQVGVALALHSNDID